jgi:probable O-glycosylation ligase (exosortase A-associated)
MLRTVLIFGILTAGFYYSLHGPFYILLFYLWNAYFRPDEKAWADFLQTINLSFIIGSFILFSTLITRKRLVLDRHIILISLFLLHALISTLLSPYYEYCFPYWIDFLKRIIVGYLMIVLVDDFSKFRMVLLVIALSLGISEAKQGWIYLVTSPGWPNMNPLPFLGDNNGVAVGMLMLVPIFALLAQTTHRKWTCLFYWLLLIGVLYRALSTHSRGGFLACCFLGGIYWLQSRRKIRTLVALVAVMVVVVTNLPDTFWVRMDTINMPSEEYDESALARLHFWQVALSMAQAHPIFGVGFNAFNIAYDNYDFSDGAYGRMRSVHNSYFGIVSELGYLGFLIFIIVILCAFVSCNYNKKLIQSDHELSRLKMAANSLRMSLIVFFIGGAFLNFQYQEMLWHFIFLLFVLRQLGKKVNYDIDRYGRAFPIVLAT